MALINCPECKKKISENAEACPGCGFKLTPEKKKELLDKKKKAEKQTGLGCLILIVVIGLGYLTGIFNSEDTKQPLTRQEKIEAQFSAWDGSHTNLKSVIKKLMNDPSSFKHVKTVYWDKKKFILVKTTFRGKNKFGGVVINSITAQFDINGKLIKIVAQNQ